MSNLKRGPYIDASYHVSVHLATQLQRRWFLRNTKNKNWRWWWRLLTDRDKMGKLHRGPSVYAFCQDSVHLAKRFQRRKFKCIKLTDDGRQTWWQKLTSPFGIWIEISVCLVAFDRSMYLTAFLLFEFILLDMCIWSIFIWRPIVNFPFICSNIPAAPAYGVYIS
jgi:hypothetical protein